MSYRKRYCTIFRLRLERRARKYLSKMGAPDWVSTSSAHRKTTFLDQCKYKIIPLKQFPLTWGEEGHAVGGLKPQGLCFKKAYVVNTQLTFCLKLEIANQYGNFACRRNCHALSCIQQIPLPFISLRDACKIERGVTVRQPLEQLTLRFVFI